MRRARENDFCEEDSSNRSNTIRRRVGEPNNVDPTSMKMHTELLHAVQSLRNYEVLHSISSDIRLPRSLWSHTFVEVASDIETHSMAEELESPFCPDWHMDTFYANKILGLQHNREREYRAHPNYFQFHPQLSPLYRASLVQLMITATRKFHFQSEVLHQAVGLLDRYLSNSTNIAINDLDEIGVASLLLAYKNENANDLYFPLNEVCSLLSMEPAQLRVRVLTREIVIMEALNWTIFTPSVYSYLRRLRVVLNVQDSLVVYIARCIAERMLLEAEMLHFLPSTIAVVAMMMASVYAAKPISTFGTTRNSSSNSNSNCSSSRDKEEDCAKTPCWTPALYAACQIEQATIVPCLHAIRHIFWEETLLRAFKYTEGVFKASYSNHSSSSSAPENAIVTYDNLLLWAITEIEEGRQQQHQQSPSYSERKRLEYLAYLPGILEFSAKLFMLRSRNDIGHNIVNRDISLSLVPRSVDGDILTITVPPRLNESTLSSGTDRDDVDNSSILEEEVPSFLMNEDEHILNSEQTRHSTIPTYSTTDIYNAQQQQQQQYCSLLEALSDESTVTKLIDEMLQGTVTPLSEQSLAPNISDCVFYRYPEVYQYLVTCPPSKV